MTDFIGAGIPQLAQPQPVPPPPPVDLILPEAPTSDFSATDAVGWQDASGVIWGYVQGNNDGGGDHSVTLGIPAPATGQLPDAAVDIGSSGSGSGSGVGIILGGASLPDAFQQLDVYDDNGASDFFTVGTPGEISPPHSRAGTNTVTWPGGNANSNPTIINLPGASGTVNGVVSGNDGTGQFLRAQFFCIPIGGGDVEVWAVSNAGSPGAGTMAGFTYMIFGH